MLIRRRRAGESLPIGDDVEIEVLEAGAWGVKVGIHPPKGITILRKELRMVRGGQLQRRVRWRSRSWQNLSKFFLGWTHKRPKRGDKPVENLRAAKGAAGRKGVAA